MDAITRGGFVAFGAECMSAA